MITRTMFIAACFLAAAGVSAQQPAQPSPAGQPPQQQPDNKSPSMGERTGVNSMMNVTPSTKEFVKDVATSDMFEISSSRLAIERGDAQTKSFADRMLRDHQKTTAELKSLLQSAKVDAAPPADLDSPHQRKLDKLKQAKGPDFDKRYGEDQVDAHKEAVSLFERYSKSGDNAALKEWAATTLPTLQEHLQMAQSLPH